MQYPSAILIQAVQELVAMLFASSRVKVCLMRHAMPHLILAVDYEDLQMDSVHEFYAVFHSRVVTAVQMASRDEREANLEYASSYLYFVKNRTSFEPLPHLQTSEQARNAYATGQTMFARMPSSLPITDPDPAHAHGPEPSTTPGDDCDEGPGDDCDEPSSSSLDDRIP